MKKEFFEKLGIDEKSIQKIMAEQEKELNFIKSEALQSAKKQFELQAALQNSGASDIELLELLIVGAEDKNKAIEEAKISHPGLFTGDYPKFSAPSEASEEAGIMSFRFAAGLK